MIVLWDTTKTVYYITSTPRRNKTADDSCHIFVKNISKHFTDVLKFGNKKTDHDGEKGRMAMVKVGLSSVTNTP